MAPKKAAAGVAFSTDFSTVGTSRSGSRIFGGGGSGGTNILDEERRLIDKVFSIVDRDNSGSIDMKELEEMFKLFGVESHFLSQAISRIMTNVDKDFDGMISPGEFYKLLSQKFEKGDKRSDIESVFRRMNKSSNGQLSVDELHEVAGMLGENIPKTEVKEMLKMFSQSYQSDMKKFTSRGVKGAKDPKPEKEPEEPKFISLEDFYVCMQTELVDDQAAPQ